MKTKGTCNSNILQMAKMERNYTETEEEKERLVVVLVIIIIVVVGL